LNLRVSEDAVCILPSDLKTTLAQSTQEVLKGLPPWPYPPVDAKAKRGSGGVKLAFLVQVSVGDRLPLLRRVFDKLYSPGDLFLYSVDSQMLAAWRVREALGLTGDQARYLPNVRVEEAAHAGYFYWPRVQVLLDSMASLLEDDWDFVIHLSETDYPVHSLEWLRHVLAEQRNSNFIAIVPRCSHAETAQNPTEPALEDTGTYHDPILEDAARALADPVPANSNWYWWSQTAAVASCGSRFNPVLVPQVEYPMHELESNGFLFAKGVEWVIVTRELASYATSSGLKSFKEVIGTHAAADEIFWPTLVLNIPDFPQNVSTQGWYVHWTSTSSHSPDFVTIKNLADLKGNWSNYIFVRKVEEDLSRSLLDEIDKSAHQEMLELKKLKHQKQKLQQLQQQHQQQQQQAKKQTPTPAASPTFLAPNTSSSSPASNVSLSSNVSIALASSAGTNSSSPSPSSSGSTSSSNSSSSMFTFAPSLPVPAAAMAPLTGTETQDQDLLFQKFTLTVDKDDMRCVPKNTPMTLPTLS